MGVEVEPGELRASIGYWKGAKNEAEVVETGNSAR